MEDKVLKDVLQVILDNKGEDVVYLNVTSFNPLAEYFVICSVSSNRQALALAKYVDDTLAKHNIYIKHIENSFFLQAPFFFLQSLLLSFDLYYFTL